MEDRVYRLEDGRLWDTSEARWVASFADGEVVVDLVSASGQSDEAYLVKTLAFYGFPLGELVMFSEKGVKEELAELDAEYLTPRTLAGLSINDEEAIERYAKHEDAARPLRERLAALEKN